MRRFKIDGALLRLVLYGVKAAVRLTPDALDRAMMKVDGRWTAKEIVGWLLWLPDRSMDTVMMSRWGFLSGSYVAEDGEKDVTVYEVKRVVFAAGER